MAANRANYIAWPETVADEENHFFDKNVSLSTAVTTYNLLPIDGVLAAGSSAPHSLPDLDPYTASIESGRQEEWDQHRNTIQRLLITEGHTLAAVREIMLHEYGLRGTYGAVISLFATQPSADSRVPEKRNTNVELPIGA
jgi:hypothetical protein